MTSYSLLFTLGNNPAGFQQELVLDLVVTQTHSLDADVTSYPIENGVQPSDHYQPKAEPVQLEAVVADYVLGETEATPGRARDKLNTLMRIRQTGTLVTLVSGDRTVANLALTHLGFSFNDNSQSAIKVSLTLQEVVVVETRVAKLIIKRAAPEMKGEADEGNKASTPTEAPENSWAWDGFGPPDDPDNALVNHLAVH